MCFASIVVVVYLNDNAVQYLSVQRQHEKITRIKPELTLSSLHVV